MDKILGLLKAKAPYSIVGVLLVGIVCSAIYDGVIKPGFSLFSKVLFDLFTFGSQRAQDFTYSNAALDPTSLPSILGMVLIMAVLLGGFLMLNVDQSLKNREFLEDMAISEEMDRKIDEIVSLFGHDPQKLETELAAMVHERKQMERPSNDENASTKRMLRVTGFISWTILAFSLIGGWLIVTATNQSLIVWREFNADLKIVAPYISEEEVAKLQSKFAQIRTEREYKEVRSVLDAQGELHKLNLRGKGD